MELNVVCNIFNKHYYFLYDFCMTVWSNYKLYEQICIAFHNIYIPLDQYKAIVGGDKKINILEIAEL